MHRGENRVVHHAECQSCLGDPPCVPDLADPVDDVGFRGEVVQEELDSHVRTEGHGCDLEMSGENQKGNSREVGK